MLANNEPVLDWMCWCRLICTIVLYDYVLRVLQRRDRKADKSCLAPLPFCPPPHAACGPLGRAGSWEHFLIRARFNVFARRRAVRQSKTQRSAERKQQRSQPERGQNRNHAGFCSAYSSKSRLPSSSSDRHNILPTITAIQQKHTAPGRFESVVCHLLIAIAVEKLHRIKSIIILVFCDMSTSSSSDDKTSKKKERLEQNRLSARESRKRKKVRSSVVHPMLVNTQTH